MTRKLTEREATSLQSDIMKEAHRLRTGIYISSDESKQAADIIAKRERFESGTDLHAAINRATASKRKRSREKTFAQTSFLQREQFIEKLTDQLEERIAANDGEIGMQWQAAKDLGVEPKDIRHARKVLRTRGYVEDSRGSGFKYHKVLRPAASDNNVINSPLQPEIGPQLCRYDKANHEEMMETLLRIATLLGTIADRQTLIMQAILGNTARVDKLIELWR